MHTLGPWRWIYEKEPGFDDEPIALVGPSGEVCRFCDEAPYISPGLPPNKHDAALIAMAPELFALALRVARLNRDAGEIGAGMPASLVDEARRLTDPA